MPVTFSKYPLRTTLLACIALPAMMAGQADAQTAPAAAPDLSIGNDLLEPLVEPESSPAAQDPDQNLTIGNDLLESLVEPEPSSPPAAEPDMTLGNDLIVPLVEAEPPPPPAQAEPDLSLGNDLLEPLEWNPPSGGTTSRPGYPIPDPLLIDIDQFERELAEHEAYRDHRNEQQEQQQQPVRTILVQRNYVDPCGSFSVSWGGTKKCQPLQRTRWELVDVDRDEEEDNDHEPPAASDGRTGPGSGSGGSPGPGASPDGASAPGGAPGPGAAPPPDGAGPDGAPPKGGGGAGSGAGSTTAGPESSPGADGFATIGEFAVRIDHATQMADGNIDLLATFRTRTEASRLIGNGDWRIYVTDADGVSTDTTALYSPAPGTLQPFAQMPYVSASAPAQVRLRVVLPAGMAAVTSATVMLMGQHAATYPIGPLGSDSAPAPQPGTAAGAALKQLEVRADHLETVGQTTELSFAARNMTDRPQFAHGTYLRFSGTRNDGTAIMNTGRVHGVRGNVGRHFEGITVLPGQTGRFRVIFDAPGVHGPITVTDGSATATLTLPAAPEPVW